MGEIEKYQAYERLSADAKSMGGLIERTMKRDAQMVDNDGIVRALLEVQNWLARVNIWAESRRITDFPQFSSRHPLPIEEIGFE